MCDLYYYVHLVYYKRYVYIKLIKNSRHLDLWKGSLIYVVLRFYFTPKFK